MNWFFKTICLLYLAQFLTFNICYSQSKISIGLELSPGFSSIKPMFPNEITSSSSKQSLIFDLGLNGRFYFTRMIGIESGIKLLTFKSGFTANAYQIKFITADSENENYERRVSGKEISESATVKLINIPIHIILRSKVSKKISIYGSFGPEISKPIQEKTHGKGIFTYKGFYSKYGTQGVEIVDVPAYGFVSNDTIDVKNSFKMEMINFGLGAGAGVSYSLDKKYEVYASLNYRMPITKMVSKADGNYYISNEMGSFNSFLTNGNAKFNNISLTIGIQINLKRIPKY